MRKLIGPFLFCILFFFLGALFEGEQVLSWQRHGVALTTCELGNAPSFGAFPDRVRDLPHEKPASAASLRESPRRRKARNAGDVYRHPRAIFACVSFSQKIFCFAKSFL